MISSPLLEEPFARFHFQEDQSMLKRYLLAPGPTPVPPEVLLAMARPMIHHRAPEFDPIFAEVA